MLDFDKDLLDLLNGYNRKILGMNNCIPIVIIMLIGKYWNDKKCLELMQLTTRLLNIDLSTLSKIMLIKNNYFKIIIHVANEFSISIYPNALKYKINNNNDKREMITTCGLHLI